MNTPSTSENAPSNAPVVLGCSYAHRGSTLECRGDGYLWDADSDGYDPDDETSPCPCCNTKEFLANAVENAGGISEGQDNGHHYTGESMWVSAVAVARQANPEVAEALLNELGTVVTLVPAPERKERYAEVIFTYPENLP